jgi:hypothetical protein
MIAMPRDDAALFEFADSGIKRHSGNFTSRAALYVAAP